MEFELDEVIFLYDTNLLKKVTVTSAIACFKTFFSFYVSKVRLPNVLHTQT